MKKLLAFILVLLVLGAVVPGCRHALRYDGRLAAADSLMRDFPDSALALVSALDTADLPAEGDRAYRDLLLTQARYKAYVTATSDSDITRALAWFRAHPADREKLTRAYIYKGAVMDELGHPDSAMLYYKHAEATAAPDDYFNLGYAKMRMGALYRDNYSMDGKHIEKYEEALECFNNSEDQHYKLVSMINLGSLYCMQFPQKADSLLNEALVLSSQLGDTLNYVVATQNLIKNCINQHRYEQARKMVQKVMAMNTPKVGHIFYIYAAHAYAGLHMADSAQMFLDVVSLTPETREPDQIAYMEGLAEIMLAKGDTASYQTIYLECRQIEDSLMSLQGSVSIAQTEIASNKKAIEKILAGHHRYRVILAVFLLALAVSAFVFFIKYRRQLKWFCEIRCQSEFQLEELNLLQKRLDDFNIQDQKLQEFITSQMRLMRNVMEECYHVPNNQLSQKIKEIIKYQEGNGSEWEKLYEYIDSRYHNIISETKATHPRLSQKDLLLIALSTLDCSCIQIAIILGYANATTIGGNRVRLARKMGLDCSLREYIERFKKD